MANTVLHTWVGDHAAVIIFIANKKCMCDCVNIVMLYLAL